MNSERHSLIVKITAEVEEIGKVLEENGITDDKDIQALCYEALSDIYPGRGLKIVQRSKAWKIIQASLKNENQIGKGSSSIESRSASPSSLLSATSPRSLSPSATSRSSSPSATSISSSPFATSRSSSPSATPKSSSPYYTPLEPAALSTVSDEEITITKWQQAFGSVKEETDINPSVLIQSVSMKRPAYTIYSDADVLCSSKNGAMSSDIRNRLVRGTIHNMVSAASSPPFNRFPTHSEIEEMSKSLIITYPCLKDGETGHGVLLKQLKRRLGNTKPIKKRQGPCPKKRKTFHTGTSNVKEEEVALASPALSTNGEDNLDGSRNSNNDDCSDGKEIMGRHYNSLKREMDKKNPNEEVVNCYLDKEYPARREWLTNILAEERAVRLLEVYPCFKDHVEVVEEARRVLMIEGTDRKDFLRKCVDRLANEVEFLVYYGIDSKEISPPRSPKLNAKIVHVLTFLSTMFNNKKFAKKQNQELVHQLKDHEDPDVWCTKKGGNVPALLMDKEHCYVIVGRSILFKVQVNELPEAVVAFLAAFYLLDVDYPKCHEIGMNLLQYFIFEDKNVPKDIAVHFNAQLSAYKKFKTDAV